MRLENKWNGTYDRGDGEADLEIESPQCPDRQAGVSDCGGDAYLLLHAPDSDPDNLQLERWQCSDCDNQWNGLGEEVE